jgi:hypothetical protein
MSSLFPHHSPSLPSMATTTITTPSQQQRRAQHACLLQPPCVCCSLPSCCSSAGPSQPQASPTRKLWHVLDRGTPLHANSAYTHPSNELREILFISQLGSQRSDASDEERLQTCTCRFSGMLHQGFSIGENIYHYLAIIYV